jgi:hypothetical protein
MRNVDQGIGGARVHRQGDVMGEAMLHADLLDAGWESGRAWIGSATPFLVGSPEKEGDEMAVRCGSSDSRRTGWSNESPGDWTGEEQRR